MAHCADCYGTNTIQPCDTLGCISTNYAKCILYSGENLYCSTGAIGTISFTGTAVVPGTETTYTGVTGTNVSGTGVDATFEVTTTPGSDQYTVTPANLGSGYEIGDQITISGDDVGGATPANDITLTITALNPVIPTGAALDSIIVKFHEALCSGTSGGSGGGLDYSSLNYSCLRQNGVLTGIGTPITTESQFVQSASAALCSVNTKLDSYDTTINITTLETGLNISGFPTAPYTLNAGLEGLGTAIMSLNTIVDLSSLDPDPCVAYSFTGFPTGNTDLYSYFSWITSNMCGMYGDLSSTISTNTSTISSLKTYIAGAGTVPTAVNTSALPGGSTVSTASAAINLLVSEVADLNTQIASVPSGNYSLTWASCFGGTYPSNSVFKGQTWNWPNTSATLQTQLDRIVSVLSTLNVKFDASQFTVTTGSCGPTIGISSAIAFTPASLNAASIDDLGDVDTSSAADGDLLVYETGVSPAEWVSKSFDVTINGSSTGVTRTEDSGSIVYDLTVADTTPSLYPLTPVNTSTYTVSNAVRFTLGTQSFPYGTLSGDLVILNGVFQMNITDNLTWSHNQGINIANVPTELQSTGVHWLNATAFFKISGLYSTTNTNITVYVSGSSVTAFLTTPSTLNLTSGDLVEIAIGGATYHKQA